ncbi:MAG: tetratricopeptide repeat protein [Candidatus Sulfotelmatobacter sp.]
MKQRRKVSIIAGACLIFSLAASALLLHRIDQLRPQSTLEDVLYISSPKVLKRASLGYDGLLADIYWTRAVQYFGSRHHNQAGRYNLLAPLLEITTQLDPHLIVAYEFGASFLAPPPPSGAGQPDRAIQLMEYGIQSNPDDWKLYYDLGFVYYMNLKDYPKAADAFERGSKVPNAHPFLRLLAAQMAEHAGDFSTARMLWSATYQNSQDKQIRANAVEHLRALRVDEDVTHLQQAVTRFGGRTGRLPTSMSELVAAEGLPGIPVDPDQHPYKLTAEGRVEVRVPDDFPFATKGLPQGYKLQPKIHGEQP